MDALDRLSTGEKIVGISAILLFVFMFFDWFGVEAATPGFSGALTDVSGNADTGGNAWDWLNFIPIVLIITIVAALVMVGLRFADSVAEPVVPMSVVVTVLGGISFLLILYRVIDPPGTGEAFGVEVDVDVTREIGVFLSLVAAGLITYGGYKTMQEEGTSFGDAADRLGGGGPGGPSGGPPPPPPPPSQQPPPPPPGQQPPPPSSSAPPPPQPPPTS